jgi:hypothetical protein
LLYIGSLVEATYKAFVDNLFALAKFASTEGSAFMIAGGLDILPICAIATLLVLFEAKIAKCKNGGYFKSFRVRSAFGNSRAFDRFFERRSPARKPCPNCGERVPLSTILCAECAHNFLADRPGRGQRLLPSVEPMAQDGLEQSV